MDTALLVAILSFLGTVLTLAEVLVERVAGVAVKRVPVYDAAGRRTLSETAALVIWVEVRADAPGWKVRQWQASSVANCGLVGKNEVPVADARLGPDRFLDTGLPFVQPLVPGARRTNVLVYAVPGKELGDLVLTLDAERVGQRGDFRFPIPRAAFAP